jgi:hypothetical protein
MMTDEQMREAYAQTLPQRGASSRASCPNLEALLALVERAGSDLERIETLDHALTCPACRRELEVLRSFDRAGRALAAEVRPRAARTGTVVGHIGWRRHVPLALAASLLLAVGLGIGRALWDPGVDDQLRTPAVADGVTLATPADGATTGATPTFAWRAVPDARQYAFEVVTPDGVAVLAARTADTTLVPAAGTLSPGEYRWSVRAQLRDGTELRSFARPLRIRGP